MSRRMHFNTQIGVESRRIVKIYLKFVGCCETSVTHDGYPAVLFLDTWRTPGGTLPWHMTDTLRYSSMTHDGHPKVLIRDTWRRPRGTLPWHMTDTPRYSFGAMRPEISGGQYPRYGMCQWAHFPYSIQLVKHVWESGTGLVSEKWIILMWHFHWFEYFFGFWSALDLDH